MRSASVLSFAILLTGCATSPGVERGRMLVSRYGCASCHEFPDRPNTGKVGPPLAGVARRSYLAGRLPNTQENLLRWIRFPQQVDESTVMPDMLVTESDGRDIVAFLYSLR